MSRLPPLSGTDLLPEQQAIFDQISTGARGRVTELFMAMLHSPMLAGRVEQVGAYVRFESAAPERQRELAILVVARHWRCAYEWCAHARLALLQGVRPAAIQAIADGLTPNWSEDEALDAVVHAYASQLLASGAVADDTYASATKALGVKGVVDLTGLIGYYTLLAFTLNAHEVELPAGAAVPPGFALSKIQSPVGLAAPATTTEIAPVKPGFADPTQAKI